MAEVSVAAVLEALSQAPTSHFLISLQATHEIVLTALLSNAPDQYESYHQADTLFAGLLKSQLFFE